MFNTERLRARRAESKQRHALCTHHSVLHLLLATSALLFAAQLAQAGGRVACPAGVDPKASNSLGSTAANSRCTTGLTNGYPLPDASCTPGAINPTVTLDVLQGGDFKTGCERDTATSAAKKAKTYGTYAVDKPKKNTGKNQTCELDHLISLELGGADTLDNIWPQCGPDDVALAQRYFKVKDSVENYLAVKVKAGEISLDEAQHGIASNWTQYIEEAQAYWSTHAASGFGLDE